MYLTPMIGYSQLEQCMIMYACMGANTCARVCVCARNLELEVRHNCIMDDICTCSTDVTRSYITGDVKV